MSEVSDRYAVVADGFTTRLGGVQPHGWDSPSPCSEWTARDLVTHVVNTHRRVLANVDGTEPEVVDAADELSTAWSHANEGVRGALADARAEAIVGGMFGEQPFESLVGRLLCADTLIHTWDLARATGQDDRLDEAAVAKAIEFLSPLDGAIRRPGGFGPKIDPPADADEQARLLCFAGRAT
jgi:uncharacterized protein (TIGR03086 family)